MTNSRPLSPIDRIAEAWVDTLVEHDPTTGTYIGRRGGGLPDYSPEGAAAFADAQRSALAALDAEQPVDAVDAVTRADLTAELRLGLAQYEAGEELRDLNVIESPLQQIRDSFDLMPTATDADWAEIGERLRAVPAALAGYRASLTLGAERGLAPALRQVTEVAAQSRRTAGTAAAPGFFGQLVAGRGAEFEAAAADAARAYAECADVLETELAPRAATTDAFGRERYALASEAFLGARVDLDETYAWGIEELARMVDEQERIAAEIVGGARHPGIVAEAIALLERDERRKLHGTDALQRWMQETSDRAVAELGATQFDIPQEIRALECMIAPTQEGGIYYTGPSDDFSRPGRMWWSVPEGVTEFDTWRELTTVYHEGVPGHHLQIGQAVVNRGTLNEWRRQLAGTSGHAEGWALYAERLMEQLGYLDDPADRLGMLDGQRMRAARVVLDIGVHLGKPHPDGGAWNGDKAFEFMAQHVNMNEGFVRFEVLRYLGWAGQAPSYKVGQRIWEQLRDEAAAAAGSGFDVRDFHRDALALGGVRLDTLQRSLRGELGA
ncbi:DUF885 domain-containing protein [Leucobacter chromiireducens]|uniref:DUF885 domain-containing protein n=1 Tax=Leucobacter chromiireducens subsp. solipictus TaxID=398235 RepID=A0ABS1SFG1_9MICO|nr:DUF885 domain-containing protein [Leucobacter chromiireducens]MBL3678048.1 DUF885 domain-containing protein [Leucobacter chromiireducens subsp. solipictus]